MEQASATRGFASLLIAVALALGVVAAGPVRAADQPPAPAEGVTAASPAGPAGETTAMVVDGQGAAGTLPSDSAPPAAAPPPAPKATAAAPEPAAVPAPTGPGATADPAPVAAAPPAEPSSAAAPGPGVAAPPEAEARPEGVEEAPVLVGPDDDKLLQEVEKHVNIAPAGPAIKISEPAYDIPLELNAKVLDYVEIFQTTRRRSFEAGLARSRKYESLMKPVFAELGIPTDLYYLALIESGYNPKAYSYAKAMGIWQFISSTGKIYGLRRTDWLDERRDPMKSTRAAARHLKDLFDELGSWPLALAAYNAGKGRVQRSIAKAGTDDFWSLDLPGQTRNYVPAFFAAVIISKDPERYGFQPEYEELAPAEVVEVGGGTRLSLVAALCRTSVDAIQDLNPELRKSTVPPGGPYALKIPAGTLDELTAGLAKVPAGRTTAGLSSYHVAPGDTLFSIAQRFGTNVEAIRDANRLRDSEIRTGQLLTIPGPRVAMAPIPRAPGRIVVSSSIPGSYRVQAGDNPWSIARRFNMPLDALLALNGLDTDSVLSIGQALVLRPDAGEATATARAAAAPRAYQVRKGDNLWQISRKFDIPIEDLRRLNGLGAGHDLQPGDRVVLP